MKRPRFTPQELDAAFDKTLEDVIAPGLDILFVGINPGRYSGAAGHHFAGPGNRFWPALRDSGLTPRLLSPLEDRELLRFGLGVTNLVDRTTATAAELDAGEIETGARRLVRKIEHYEPRVVAFLGLSAYRAAFGDRRAVVGEQEARIGRSHVWLLPNTSGLNAHYRPADFARLFAELAAAARHPDA